MENERNDFEATALRVLRSVRHRSEQLGQLGDRFVGVTDWLEAAIPRVNRILSDAAHAAFDELMRPPRASGQQDPRDQD